MQQLLLNLTLVPPQTTANKANEKYGNIVRMRMRSDEFRAVQFKSNSLSDHDCLVSCRFKSIDIGRLSNIIYFSDITARNAYACDVVTATCIFFPKI